MARGDEADLDVADLDAFTIGNRLPVLVAVADPHDRQRFGRRQHRAMAAAGVVGVAVGDHCPRLGLGRIDPRVGGRHVNPLRMGLDPGTDSGHWTVIPQETGGGSGRGRRNDMDAGGFNWSLMNIVGPDPASGSAAVARPAPQQEPQAPSSPRRRPKTSMTRRSAAAARGPTSSERARASTAGRRLVRRQRLGAAPPPARNARSRASGAKRAARRGHGRGQDAGRVPPRHLRPGRAARSRASTRSTSRR